MTGAERFGSAGNESKAVDLYLKAPVGADDDAWAQLQEIRQALTVSVPGGDSDSKGLYVSWRQLEKLNLQLRRQFGEDLQAVAGESDTYI